MFDISWGEMALIGVVALIVIKPEDLPATIRGIGQMVAKVRRMASDFQGQFNQALREAEAEKVTSAFTDLKSDMDKVTGFNPVSLARDQMKAALGDIKGEMQGPPAAPPPSVESQLPPPPALDDQPLNILSSAEAAPEKPKRSRKTPVEPVAATDKAAEPPKRSRKKPAEPVVVAEAAASEPVSEPPKKRRKKVSTQAEG